MLKKKIGAKKWGGGEKTYPPLFKKREGGGASAPAVIGQCPPNRVLCQHREITPTTGIYGNSISLSFILYFIKLHDNYCNSDGILDIRGMIKKNY